MQTVYIGYPDGHLEADYRPTEQEEAEHFAFLILLILIGG
jgi:hypothetical protein